METIHSNLATLKSVEAIMEETDRAIVPVVGDCLDSFPATLGSTPTLHGEVTAV